MWLPERKFARFSKGLSRLLLAGTIVVCASALAGCNFRPLYATGPGGLGVQHDLKGIEIAPMDTRVGQRLRNNLVFGFGGGSDDAEKRYDLRIILTETDTEVSVEKFTDVPASKLLALTASFTLTDRSNRTILTGSSFANASYDISTQRFANIRAKRDAQDRAAMVVADDIRARIAAHFISSGKSP